MDEKILKGEKTIEIVTLEAEVGELEDKIAPGRGYNHNETMVRDRYDSGHRSNHIEETTMNSKIGTLMASIAIVLTCMFCLEQPAVAQTISVKATDVDVCAGGPICAGTVTQGGILNGTSVTVFSPAVTPTPDPDTLSFSFDWTVTTVQGQLKASFVNLFNVITGVTTCMGSIDPNNSTGRFAGASGVLFMNGTAINNSPFTVKLDVTGKINLDNQARSRFKQNGE